MDLMDILIGILLIHAVPHLMLGFWKHPFYSPIGRSSNRNLIYGILVALTAGALFFYEYGIDGLMEHGIFLGGFVMILIYMVFGKTMYSYQKKHNTVPGR